MAIVKKRNIKKINPCIPLRDLVIFPHMVVPLLVGRTRSLNAVEESLNNNGYIVIAFQKNPLVEDPTIDDLYTTGVLAKVIQSIKEPSGVMKILVEVLERVRIKNFVGDKKYYYASIEVIKEEKGKDKETEALMRVVLDLVEKYINLIRSVPKEIYGTISLIEEPSKFCDTIAGYMPLKVKDKARVIETIPIKERLRLLIEIFNNEIGVLEVQKKIQDKVVKKIEETQKQYFLHEQLKEIQKELGKEGESPETSQLKEKILKAKMPKNVENKAMEELSRLSKMMPMSPEATVVRTYLEWLINLPWQTSTEDNIDISHAEEILNEDHYGLEKVKERILEYLAVKKKTNSLKGPILALLVLQELGKHLLESQLQEHLEGSL